MLLVTQTLASRAMAQGAPSRTRSNASAVRVATPASIRDVGCESPASTSAAAPTLAWRGTDVRWAEWRVVLGARRIAATMVVVEIDPSRVRLALDIVREGDALGAWSIANAPADAAVAFNAGQFTDEGPWGWVVHRGREWQAPGRGPLAAAVVVDSAGAVRIVGAADTDGVRAKGGVIEALQSYPLILDNGRLPRALCDTTRVDETHRDIRFVLGTRDDGTVLLVLSRYGGAGGVAGRLPIGPTTREMADIVRRLGADRALMLDGGLSAQLLVRDNEGTHEWNGLRRVPLAMVGVPVAKLAPRPGPR
jgi:hypothetical protein